MADVVAGAAGLAEAEVPYHGSSARLSVTLQARRPPPIGEAAAAATGAAAIGAVAAVQPGVTLRPVAADDRSPSAAVQRYLLEMDT